MSVIGIDFGAQSTKIGVARNKGIDIVRVAPPRTSSAFHAYDSWYRHKTLRRLWYTDRCAFYRLQMKSPTDLRRKFSSSTASSTARLSLENFVEHGH